MSQYIKLEDVQKIIQRGYDRWNRDDAIGLILSNINSLPTISPESMIKEMLDIPFPNKHNSSYFFNEGYNDGLRKLLQRLKS